VETIVKTQAIANWIQTLTGLAVLAGLVLVVWELQQGRDVAMAQMTSDGFDLAAQISLAEMGENPALVFDKACTNPAAMSESDLMVLDSYNRALLIQIRRAYTIERRSGLYAGTWKEIAPWSFGGVFDTVPGRIWWRESKDHLPAEIQDLGDELLSNQSDDRSCLAVRWKTLIAAAGDGA
jgi:hypothetical protein